MKASRKGFSARLVGLTGLALVAAVAIDQPSVGHINTSSISLATYSAIPIDTSPETSPLGPEPVTTLISAESEILTQAEIPAIPNDVSPVSTIPLASLPSFDTHGPGASEDPSPVDQYQSDTHSRVGDGTISEAYRYYERGPRVVALQMDLGMRSVDGVYGPKTRRAHIRALGGPSAAVYILYPELGQTEQPCSHGCEPGDGHYELPTLGELVDRHFLPEDRAWALKVAFCESSGLPHHIGSEVVSSAIAIGWFQHLARYWSLRSTAAGWENYDPFHAEANVAVASWLFYRSGAHHWNPSKACWGKKSNA